MQFPPSCPEVPVASLSAALTYYRDRLGFTVDWADGQIGLAGLSQGDSRLFMASSEYRSVLGNRGPVVLWLNVASRDEVRALHDRWAAAGANIAGAPEAKPYKLFEFLAEDLDGNVLRVFYDFAWEAKWEGSSRLG
ncbi:MAG: VOC family protein [Xanthobacteraceae bacterium]|nr:VOC family protein [Xanthobacteraceae bacterium]